MIRIDRNNRKNVENTLEEVESFEKNLKEIEKILSYHDSTHFDVFEVCQKKITNLELKKIADEIEIVYIRFSKNLQEILNSASTLISIKFGKIQKNKIIKGIYFFLLFLNYK